MSFATKVYKPGPGDKLRIKAGGAIQFDAATPITLTLTGNNIIIANLPTSDPAVAGALWADTNVLKVSAGGG